MNSSTQAQKGFKTFLLTLVISLVVFSAIYYIINSDTSSSETISEAVVNQEAKNSQLDQAPSAVIKSEDVDSATLGESDTRSAFGEIASTPSDGLKSEPKTPPTVTKTTPIGGPGEVLAGAASGEDSMIETTQSTVPTTGFFGPTFGLFFSFLALGIAAYLIYLGPRKLALSSFEKDVIKDLDKK